MTLKSENNEVYYHKVQYNNTTEKRKIKLKVNCHKIVTKDIFMKTFLYTNNTKYIKIAQNTKCNIGWC